MLIGDSGTGKSHLLIGLGVAACEAGRRVRYVTCAQLVNELAEAADERILSKVVGRYGRLDLLLVDELGYVSVDPRGAELLFQVLTEREERASVAAASNHPFSEWGQTFTDPRLAAAVVDRMTFHAHIIETGTDSYRLRTARAKKNHHQVRPPEETPWPLKPGRCATRSGSTPTTLSSTTTAPRSSKSRYPLGSFCVARRSTKATRAAPACPGQPHRPSPSPLPDAVAEAREHGFYWSEIASELGTTTSAARHRYIAAVRAWRPPPLDPD